MEACLYCPLSKYLLALSKYRFLTTLGSRLHDTKAARTASITGIKRVKRMDSSHLLILIYFMLKPHPKTSTSIVKRSIRRQVPVLVRTILHYWTATIGTFAPVVGLLTPPIFSVTGRLFPLM